MAEREVAAAPGGDVAAPGGDVAAPGGDVAAPGGDVAAPGGPPSSDPNLVVWDLELCPLPDCMEETSILSGITGWLSDWGYSGPVEMLAVGRPRSLPRYKLAYSGIYISHVSDGRRSMDLNGKHTSDGLLGALSSWIKNKPAPANILFIAGDRSFDSKVESLRNANYNVLLRQEECTCFGVENHANYCWTWWELFDGGGPHGLSLGEKLLEGWSGPPMEGWSGEAWSVPSGPPMEGWFREAWSVPS